MQATMCVAAVAVVMAVAVVATPVPQDAASSESRESQEWAVIPYNYGYEVQDPDTNNFQNKAEVKTADEDVYGSYSVLMPDGYIYTTTYNVTKGGGYVSRLVKTLAYPADDANTSDEADSNEPGDDSN